MLLRKQALLVFKGSPNPCFVIKTSKHTTLLYVRFSSKTFLLAKGKSLLTKKVRQNKVLFNKGKFVESFYFIFSTLFCHINIAFLKLIPLILYLKNKIIE
jgi:hypothetical protein